MVDVIVIVFKGREVEVFDKDGVFVRGKFIRLKESDLKSFFIGHCSEGVRICAKVDEEAGK